MNLCFYPVAFSEKSDTIESFRVPGNLESASNMLFSPVCKKEQQFVEHFTVYFAYKRFFQLEL
jgi:hypothetical protein